VADPLTGRGTQMAAEHAFLPAEPFRMPVEEGKIHEFARATRSRCPDHLREFDPVAPVTFLASHRLWMSEQNSAWRGITRDLRGVLHGEEEFLLHGPPPAAGTQLTARQSVERSYDKQGGRGGAMTFTELVTRFWTADEDRPVAEERTITIRRHTLPQAGGATPSAPAVAPEPGERLFEHEEPPLTVTDFVKYQGASGDFNPIHHDTAFAVGAGNPGPFAVGMLSAGIAANLITERLGADAVRRFRVRWQNQAWPGDALVYRGTRLADGRVHLHVLRPDGSAHLTAWAETVS
jgi:acyl dehydratase